MLGLGSEYRVRVLICPLEQCRERVKVSHVIVECRMINNYSKYTRPNVSARGQFDSFVARLNQLCGAFGISFGDWSFGSSINFLDVTLFVDDDGFIQYRLFKKPTDLRLYLKSNSFHPSHVFDSVAFSQIKRVMRRNSTPEFAEEDVSDLIEDLVKCGYQRERLINLVAKLNQVLVIPFFKEIGELKRSLKSLQSDIKILTGNDTHTLIAARKGRSVASVVVKNNQLCASVLLLRLRHQVVARGVVQEVV